MLGKAILGSLIATITIACSATGRVNCEGNFYYDDSFTSEQQEWIQESSARWNTWVGRPVTSVRSGSDYACMISVGKTSKESAVGETSRRLQNIIIDMDDLKRLNKATKAYFEGVVMHEMGHAIGYDHKGADGKALMAPAGSVDFTEIDRIECIKKDMCTTLLPPTTISDSSSLPPCHKSED